jgi:hypothetical protein
MDANCEYGIFQVPISKVEKLAQSARVVWGQILLFFLCK